MVDLERQVPSPAASAWLINLGHLGGPVFVVHRLAEREAPEAPVEHLVAIGSRSPEEAEEIVGAAEAQSVAVIW